LKILMVLPPMMADPIGSASLGRIAIRPGRQSVPVSACPPQGGRFSSAGQALPLGGLTQSICHQPRICVSGAVPPPVARLIPLWWHGAFPVGPGEAVCVHA
jgi:hypothetical protein